MPFVQCSCRPLKNHTMICQRILKNLSTCASYDLWDIWQMMGHVWRPRCTQWLCWELGSGPSMSTDLPFPQLLLRHPRTEQRPGARTEGPREWRECRLWRRANVELRSLMQLVLWSRTTELEYRLQKLRFWWMILEVWNYPQVRACCTDKLPSHSLFGCIADNGRTVWKSGLEVQMRACCEQHGSSSLEHPSGQSGSNTELLGSHAEGWKWSTLSLQERTWSQHLRSDLSRWVLQACVVRADDAIGWEWIGAHGYAHPFRHYPWMLRVSSGHWSELLPFSFLSPQIYKIKTVLKIDLLTHSGTHNKSELTELTIKKLRMHIKNIAHQLSEVKWIFVN